MQRSTIDNITKGLVGVGGIIFGFSALASGTDYLLNGKSDNQLYFLSGGLIIGSTLAIVGYIVNNEYYTRSNKGN